MKALYFDGAMEMREIAEPELHSGEALIRVLVAGVCRTDIEISLGYMGFSGVPGHEFVGVVEKAGSVEDEKWTGKRIVGEINLPEGDCEMCRMGLGRHCNNREVLGIVGRNGAFAEKLTLPVANLFEVPSGMADETAVFVEPVAACFEILEQVSIRGGEKALVIGDGRLGSLAAQVLAGAGAAVTVVGKHKDKLEIISREFGIKAVDAESAGDEKFDIAVECSGRPSGLELATAKTRPRGTIVLKSTYHDKPVMDMSLWVINELTVVGSRCGPFAPAISALERGEVNPLPLIEKVFPFADALEAFNAARRPGAMKILMKM